MAELYTVPLWPWWVTDSPSRNTEDVGSVPDTGRYIVARMTTENGGPLSLDPISSGGLKNLKDVDNVSNLRAILYRCTVEWVI